MWQINDVEEGLNCQLSYSGMVFWFNHLLSVCSGYRLKNYIGSNFKCRFLNVKPSLIPVEKLETYFLQGERNIYLKMLPKRCLLVWVNREFFVA